jgi:4-amino-4-deoxy-L-arabinose transferase-like glycosyltransferase
VGNWDYRYARRSAAAADGATCTDAPPCSETDFDSKLVVQDPVSRRKAGTARRETRTSAGLGQRFGTTALLLILLFVALALRLEWLTTRAVIIENEGGEYATIAANLMQGKGYIGQGELTGKPQLFIPPLYPLEIAVIAHVTGDTEVAGRLVSLAMGVALVGALYALAAHAFGRVAGLVAAGLAAIHPLLVNLSATVQSEIPYYALVCWGAYFAIRAVESTRLRYYVIAGGMFGLAFLTRQEALLLPFVLAAVALGSAVLVRHADLRNQIVGVAAAFAVFFVVVAPYVVFLYAQTGLVRLEYKSAMNIAEDRYRLQGMSGQAAGSGVDDNLNEFGAYMGDVDRRLVDIARHTSPMDELRNVTTGARPQLVNLRHSIVSLELGGPALGVLAVTGLGIGLWRRRGLHAQAFLMLMLIAVSISLFAVQHFSPRYAYVFVPFLLFWAATGLVSVSSWVTRRIAVLWGRSSIAQVIGVAAGAVLFVSVVGVAARANLVAPFDDWGSSRAGALATRQAGRWLADQLPSDKVVMDVGSAIPYYARASDYILLPYASEDVALRYIDLKAPDFVVVRGVLANQRPYLADWVQNGIPGRRDQLVYDSGGSATERIQIYRWRQR